MSSINLKLDFLVCETSLNTFLCKFYYYDNVNSAIKPWTAQQSTKQDALALMQTYSNDLYTALQNKEGITPLGGGSITDYGTYSEMSFGVVIDTGSQSAEIDYTNILSSINTNLTNLNTNITNKDNQSDIVACLNNIFTHTFSNGNVASIFKDSNANTDVEKANTNLCRLFRAIYTMLNNKDVGYGNLYSSNSNSILNDISKKLSVTVPDDNNAYVSNHSIRKLLYGLVCALSSSPSQYTTIISDSNLKAISEKLANANDLHTISQAIDLISTAIAQTPTTDVSGLTSAVQNLKLEQNNLIQVEGDIDYRIKYDKDKE